MFEVLTPVKTWHVWELSNFKQMKSTTLKFESFLKHFDFDFDFACNRAYHSHSRLEITFITMTAFLRSLWIGG